MFFLNSHLPLVHMYVVHTVIVSSKNLVWQTISLMEPAYWIFIVNNNIVCSRNTPHSLCSYVCSYIHSWSYGTQYLIEIDKETDFKKFTKNNRVIMFTLKTSHGFIGTTLTMLKIQVFKHQEAIYKLSCFKHSNRKFCLPSA